MANKWLSHVKSTMKRMKKSGAYKKGDGLKKVIMEAKKDYKKKRGGADGDESDSDSEEKPVVAEGEGGRRRRTRRHRRHRR